MTEKELFKIISEIKPGKKIPSISSERFYYFVGLESYSGRGKYRNLKGQTVIVLRSTTRKRSLFRLFMEPILLVVNCKDEILGYGHRPILNFKELRSDDQKYPNIFEFEDQYNAFSLYLKTLIP